MGTCGFKTKSIDLRIKNVPINQTNHAACCVLLTKSETQIEV